jgi:hypothetical protein
MVVHFNVLPENTTPCIIHVVPNKRDSLSQALRPLLARSIISVRLSSMFYRLLDGLEATR